MRGRFCGYCREYKVFAGAQPRTCQGCGTVQILREDREVLAKRGAHKCPRCSRRTLRKLDTAGGLYLSVCWNEDCCALEVTLAAPRRVAGGDVLTVPPALVPVTPQMEITSLLAEVRSV